LDLDGEDDFEDAQQERVEVNCFKFGFSKLNSFPEFHRVDE
jgi:hypothetical protein